MKDGGVKKCPGYSWVEIGNSKVHRFLTADQSHKSCSDIYVALEGLTMQLKDEELEKLEELKELEKELDEELEKLEKFFEEFKKLEILEVVKEKLEEDLDEELEELDELE
ncbi:hypothetical protein HPP92_000237 [Vanilla planifolia]|uniref:Uncharacterized protein n=1 Tax=Vanilla planifolia TaxID=51239 RepID=A0A835RNS3_VANPL|nr:hypothetical protein HPP92_000237 [Vanilla planifolia]